MYSSFFDCGERPEPAYDEIDWEWLIADASSPEERAAIIRERDEEAQRRLEEEQFLELAAEKYDAQQWALSEGDDIPF